MKQQDIHQLLEKFYEGSSSPQEEIDLYLKLLEQPLDSPFQKDLELIESIGFASEKLHKEKEENKLVFSLIIRQKRWAIAALLPLLLVIGAFFFFNTSTTENSFQNRRALGQEEVDLQAERAFNILNECFDKSGEKYYQASSTLQEANGFITTSFEQMDPLFPSSNDGNWQNLNYYE